jgi:hypothetical protein
MRKKNLHITIRWIILVGIIAILGLACNIKPANEWQGLQSRDTGEWPASFKFGRPALAAEIARLDIDVRPDGTGLPEGSGNSREGKNIYLAKCAACHGIGREPLSTKLPAVPLVNLESVGQPFSNGEDHCQLLALCLHPV